jgi:hypothetical protein
MIAFAAGAFTIGTSAQVPIYPPYPGGSGTPNFVSRQAADVPTVKGAPFSGQANITIRMTQFDGQRMERKLDGKYYRDSEGRVRREQLIVGLSLTTPRKDSDNIVTIVDPVAGFIYTILGSQREVQRVPIGKVPPNVGGVPPKSLLPEGFATRGEVLGTRTIEGVPATGTKTFITVPPGMMGVDRSVEVVEERWESAELKLVLLSLQQNPVSGEVEYRLTNISRAEPPADLFKIPAGYKIVDVPGKTDITKAPF